MLYIKRLIIGMMLICVIFSFCACRIEESYKEFDIKNVTGRTIEDYVFSNELDFARVNEIVIIPEIKEIQHGKYIIYISAYSSTDSELVTIKNVTLSADGGIILDKKINLNIPVELNADDIYEGYVEVGYFTDALADVSNGQKITLDIQLVVDEEQKANVRYISYEIFVKTYKSWVTPV